MDLARLPERGLTSRRPAGVRPRARSRHRLRRAGGTRARPL